MGSSHCAAVSAEKNFSKVPPDYADSTKGTTCVVGSRWRLRLARGLTTESGVDLKHFICVRKRKWQIEMSFV
jgi:hypothetical protein